MTLTREYSKLSFFFDPGTTDVVTIQAVGGLRPPADPNNPALVLEATHESNVLVFENLTVGDQNAIQNVIDNVILPKIDTDFPINQTP